MSWKGQHIKDVSIRKITCMIGETIRHRCDSATCLGWLSSLGFERLKLFQQYHFLEGDAKPFDINLPTFRRTVLCPPSGKKGRCFEDGVNIFFSETPVNLYQNTRYTHSRQPHHCHRNLTALQSVAKIASDQTRAFYLLKFHKANSVVNVRQFRHKCSRYSPFTFSVVDPMEWTQRSPCWRLWMYSSGLVLRAMRTSSQSRRYQTTQKHLLQRSMQKLITLLANKTGNVRITVTSTRVRLTIVAVEKQEILHIMSVCL